jgi:hypothetical protein
MSSATPHGDRKQSLEFCLDCYRNCIDTAMAHYLEADSEYVEPAYFRLCEQCVANCAAIGEQEEAMDRPVQLEPVLTHPRARP